MSTYLEPGWIGRFAELWERLGPETKTAIVNLLPADWSFDGKRILDFGCGAGRTLRHFMPEARQAEFWGVDIEPNIHNQSWALLRKRDVHLTVQQLESAGDDPREYVGWRLTRPLRSAAKRARDYRKRHGRAGRGARRGRGG